MTLPPGYGLRPATAEDAEMIAAHRYPDEVDAPERPIYADWVCGALNSGKYLGRLVTRGAEVQAGAGVVLLDWWPTRQDPGSLRARLVNVWTHPEHRRQGLARVLAQTLLDECQARGIHTVSLSTTAAGRPLYEALGFRAYPHEMLRMGESSP